MRKLSPAVRKPILSRLLFTKLQKRLGKKHAAVAETGDSKASIGSGTRSPASCVCISGADIRHTSQTWQRLGSVPNCWLSPMGAVIAHIQPARYDRLVKPVWATQLKGIRHDAERQMPSRSACAAETSRRLRRCCTSGLRLCTFTSI